MPDILPPKISVITVCFNAENFIEQTIQSVLSQFGQRPEYVIIDGCSKDNTMKIVGEYSGRISKIISEQDEGIYDAMNKGIRLTHGEFLYFLNAGDQFAHADVLAQVVAFFRDHPFCDIIYGDVRLRTATDGFVINDRTFKGEIKDSHYLFNNMFCQQRGFFRRSVFNQVGLFDTSYKVIADYDLVFRAYQRGMMFCYMNFEIVSIPLGGYSNYHLDRFLLERIRSLKHLPCWKWWWLMDWILSSIWRGSPLKYLKLKIRKKPLMKSDCKIMSFDIFDTTLTRCVGRPKDIFLLLQRHLINGYANLPPALIHNFYSMRFKAEIKARLRKYIFQKREIAIDDIYEQIAKKFKLNQNQIKKLIDLECDVEYRSVYPIQGTLSEIDFQRKQGKRIIFVSDMYLPLALIKSMLIKVEAYQEGDRIYLSGDIGYKKFDGSLFRYILQREQCVPRDLCHLGDNPHSDVIVPSLLGISIYKCHSHTTST